jgi:hypothetical protein
MLFGGTSAAAPCAAGVGALVLSRDPHLTRQAATNVIASTCAQIGSDVYVNGKALHYGHGRVNAHNALTSMQADTTRPTIAFVVTRSGRSVQATFSEKMGVSATVPANYQIQGLGKGTLPTTPALATWISGSTYLLEWSAGEMSSVGGATFSIVGQPGLQDIAGNQITTPVSGTGIASRALYLWNVGPKGGPEI